MLVHAIIPKPKEKFRKATVVVCCIIQKLEKVKSVCACHEAYRGSRGLVPLILYLSTRCLWVVSLIPRPHFPRERKRPYPLNRKLEGSQSRSRRFGKRQCIAPSRNHTWCSSHSRHCIDYDITYFTIFMYFSKMGVLLCLVWEFRIALVLLPSRKFIPPPCCYHWL